MLSVPRQQADNVIATCSRQRAIEGDDLPSVPPRETE
jgi:hypothetical protein